MRVKGLALKDLAIVVSDYLRKNGIESVLTGGACVAIYTKNKYISYDLDFVLVSSEKQKVVRKLLVDAGFYEEGRYFRHHDSAYFLDFIPPPLSIGEEPVKNIVEIKKRGRTLKLLSPTDCVKDRLAAFYYWKDRQALGQAVLVCQAQDVGMNEVERWSRKEGMGAPFKIFLDTLRK